MHKHPLLKRFSILVCFVLLAAAGCAKVQLPSLGGGDGKAKATITGARVCGVNLNNPVSPVPTDLPIALAAAKNEWTSFSVQVSGLPPHAAKKIVSLRVQKLTAGGISIDAQSFSAYQILPMP